MSILLPAGSSLSVQRLRADYRSGLLRPREIVDTVLARIDARGDDAVWISRFDRDTLHRRAAELEQLGDTAGFVPPPLYGVPFAVKDNIDVVGLPTTAACPEFSYSPTRHANSVRRLLDAGAIVIGKTNLDQFATGLTGVRSPYGACESVFGGDLVSGGSSSGSGVAVAAGLVSFALGTDTAGSGRVPAAMNGIVGLKPTRGLVGASGVLPACRSLDCVSVFAADLDDAAAVLGVLAGPDPDDPWSRSPRAVGPQSVGPQSVGPQSVGPQSVGPQSVGPQSVGPQSVKSQPVKPQPAPAGRTGVRLLLATDTALDFEGDTAVAAVFAAVAERAARRATEVVPAPLDPLLEAGELLYGGPWVAERLAGLADFLAAHRDAVLPVTRAVIECGAQLTAVDTFRARHRLQELRAWTARLFERGDVLLLPTVPTTFTRAEIAAEPVARNLVLGRYTQFANLLDLAAVAVPVGTTPDGRPVGVTLLGPAFSEDRLLHAASQLINREAA
jgi:allophanate hydrolase